MSGRASSASSPAEGPDGGNGGGRGTGTTGASDGRVGEQATLISARAALLSAMVAAAGLIISAIPALVGVLTWRDQQEQNQRLRADREQRLASLVSTWITAEEVKGERRSVVIIANRSQDPIHETKLSLTQTDPILGSASLRLSIGTVPPCTRVRLSSNTWLDPAATAQMTWVPNEQLKHLRKARLTVRYMSFVDQRGTKWHRNGVAGPTRRGSGSRQEELNALPFGHAIGTDALPVSAIKECEDGAAPSDS